MRVIDIAEEVPRALKILAQCQRVPDMAHRANDMLFRLQPLFENVSLKHAGNGPGQEDLEPIALLLPMIDEMGHQLRDRAEGVVQVAAF